MPSRSLHSVLRGRLERLSQTNAALREQAGIVDELCAICLEPLRVGERTRTLMCSHTYHKTCLETMLEYGVNADCPSCRSPIDGMEFITRGVLKLLRSGYPERAAQLICCIFPVGQEELVDVVCDLSGMSLL